MLKAKSYKLKAVGGFTLIEIILVMGIVTILAGASVTSFLNFRNRNRLTLTTQEIGSYLRTTESRAVSGENNQNWGMRFVNDAANSSYYYQIFYGPSYESGTVTEIYYLPNSLKFLDPADNNSTTALFTKLTGVPNAAATIKISLTADTNASSTITVNANGQIEY